uniref:Uncharacterized protein n=1 Tax=viral metagenome TaxID=1070528 RepID=A0A6M3JTU1_9ZZZZ
MGILLTEDEIEALSVWWLDAPEAVDWAETLNRAQVKKVSDFLCDFGEEKTLEACWQALKKATGLNDSEEAGIE